ncbi:MAG: twin-arginine translocase subunit TatC [Phycisphaerales bacterium]|jgi:sec-independent protein translocase protein TatC|nr:twin-arginine translocase subunit TatC [Phycisphaerales bacterium]MBT7171123.1 twin-arginine translocase subunit TatC [Phycisphaerales bacterium]
MTDPKDNQLDGTDISDDALAADEARVEAEQADATELDATSLAAAGEESTDIPSDAPEPSPDDADADVVEGDVLDDADEDAEGDELEHGKMGLVEHLDELRHRLMKALYGLVVGMAITLCFARTIIRFLTQGYVTAAKAAGIANPNVQALHMTDVMIVWMKVGLIGGAVLASPWIAYQMWQFVAAGLYKKERRIVTRTVPFSAILFSGGACFFLFVVSPTLFGAMLWFSKWMGVEVNQVLGDYLKFVTTMMLVFGISFQMPLVVAILGKIGLIDTKWINTYRRFVVVGIMIFSAFATSQSPIDTVMLAIPLWALFELGAIFVWRETRRRKAQALIDGFDDDDMDFVDDHLFETREDDDEDDSSSDDDDSGDDDDDTYTDESGYDYGEDYDEWGYYIDPEEKYGMWGKNDAHERFEAEQKGAFGAKPSDADQWMSLRSNLKESSENPDESTDESAEEGANESTGEPDTEEPKVDDTTEE